MHKGARGEHRSRPHAIITASPRRSLGLHFSVSYAQNMVIAMAALIRFIDATEKKAVFINPAHIRLSDAIERAPPSGLGLTNLPDHGRRRARGDLPANVSFPLSIYQYFASDLRPR